MGFVKGNGKNIGTLKLCQIIYMLCEIFIVIVLQQWKIPLSSASNNGSYVHLTLGNVVETIKFNLDVYVKVCTFILIKKTD